MRAYVLSRALATLTLVTTLAGCGAGQPVRVASLQGVIDDSVATACGLETVDDRKIARTVESGVRAGLWSRPGADPDCEGRRRALIGSAR